MGLSNKELMTGNLVQCNLYDTTFYGLVISILSSRRVVVDNNGRRESIDTKRLQGIPLTAEILQNAGFQLRNLNEWCNGQIKLSYDNAEKRFVFFTYTMKMVVIKYVHQLQNLFFVLAEQELEIKL